MMVMISNLNPTTQAILNRIGTRQILVSNTLEAVQQLRRSRFNAIIIDRDCAPFDTLEFVLNVRDFEPSITIVVLADNLDTTNTHALESQPQTLLLEKKDIGELITFQRTELRTLQLS